MRLNSGFCKAEQKPVEQSAAFGTSEYGHN